MKKQMNLKSNKAITLIALVITIIILIILAGVSINLVFDEDGLIDRAKQAKENMEIAQVEEQENLNKVSEYLENIDKIKTVKELKEEGIYVTSKTTVKDSNGNYIKIPEGFKIAKDSGINVTEGIVIEDKDIKEGIGNNRGNQYVWVPVGENIKKSDGMKVDITLGRYVFADGTNHKDEEGNALTKGTPILKQSSENYETETEINIKEINPTSTKDYVFQELKTNRPGIESNGMNGLNATALNLKGFIESVNNNGGYYIARYEASYGIDGKVNSKVSNTFTNDDTAPTTREEGMLWNYITQLDAATANRELYTTINSDLMNSYAWDTAIVYIQKFSEYKDYSYQTTKNETLANTGVNGDEVCKINDMASNTREWTTEYTTSSTSTGTTPCIRRGGNYMGNTYYTSVRNYAYADDRNENTAFRSMLYL